MAATTSGGLDWLAGQILTALDRTRADAAPVIGEIVFDEWSPKQMVGNL